MIQISEEKFYTLLKFFFSNFFNDYLETSIDDEDSSAVTLFMGMDFFFDLIEKYNIDFPYKTKEDYITNFYFDGEEMYKKLCIRYDEEVKDYHPPNKSFEEIFGNVEFI